MFSVRRINVVESDEGFSVEILGRNGMEYREGEKAPYVPSEIGGTDDETTMGIWKDDIRTWMRPHDLEPLTEEKRAEILKRICAALKWSIVQVEIHSKARGWVKGWIE